MTQYYIPTAPIVPSDLNDGVLDYLRELRRYYSVLFNDIIYKSSLLGISTLADNATPSILGNDKWLTGGTTTITDFDDGVTGQVINIVSEHAITITDGTNIFLSGSVNWTMAATDTLTLICKADNKWYELARSDNT
jgi:hypothetical protein